MFKFFAILFCAFLFTGCSKNELVLTDEQQVIRYLTGSGNKVWFLSKIFINDVQQVLTANQLKFNKTYTLSPGATEMGRFTNSDDDTGTWTLDNKKTLTETIDNRSRPVQFINKIIKINETSLEIENTINLTKTLEVYYAN